MKIGGAMVVASVLAGLAGCVSAPPKPAGGVPPPTTVTAKGATPSMKEDATAPAKTVPAVEAEPTAQARASQPTAVPEGAPAGEAAVVVISPSERATLPSGHYAIMVESQPSGATVVVDGIPVGRSPRRLVVPGTSMGFFRDAISIKVRFLATDAQSMSQTVEEQLTPRDRIPAVLTFTPAGAHRQLR